MNKSRPSESGLGKNQPHFISHISSGFRSELSATNSGRSPDFKDSLQSE